MMLVGAHLKALVLLQVAQPTDKENTLCESCVPLAEPLHWPFTGPLRSNFGFPWCFL